MARVKASIFIDFCNIDSSFEDLKSIKGMPNKLRIDFKKITELVTLGMDVSSKNIYLQIASNGISTEGFSSFLNALNYLQFTIITKPVKIIQTGTGEKRKADFDVEITRDICKILYGGLPCDEIILFSGDSDFACLAEDIKKYKARFTIVSCLNNVSKELLNIADRIILLDDLTPNMYQRAF
jgi:hypothetical protein